MNLKELFKTNGSRASLIIFLYILYADCKIKLNT